MENSSEVQVTIKKPGRVLHFSDGVEEEIEQEEAAELASEPQETNVDPVSNHNAYIVCFITSSKGKALMLFVSNNINDGKDPLLRLFTRFI